jgi:formiminoglutamase
MQKQHSQMKHFKFYGKQDILSLTKTRRFETKLGERIQVISDPVHFEEALKQSKAKFVIFGIPEDIGVKANHGEGGPDSAWLPFLKTFLNFQSNDFLEGSDILLLGRFDFSEIESLIESNAHDFEEKVDAYRHAVQQIDEVVEPLVKLITVNNKIPIAISGGHNNAYPLIKGAAKGLLKSGEIPLASINCINLDTSADFRPLEGRHSGNAFSYAEEDGFLQKYCIIGIHENYLTQNIWMDVVNNPFIDFITYEDIFLHERRNFLEAIAHATTFTEDSYTGIEIDLDSLHIPANGATIVAGVQPIHARQFISYASADTKTAYLHIAEGLSRFGGEDCEATGILIACLVSDFLKAKE